jgi:hypothetical protein
MNFELSTLSRLRYSDNAPPAVPQGWDLTMTTPPVGVERRVGQRFPFNLPVSLRDGSAAEGFGFTQDLSSRGAFFFTDMPLDEGVEIELTLRMPSEITLGENMRVRCRARVLRIVKAGAPNGIFESGQTEGIENSSAETKIGVAVCLSHYEYLTEDDDGPATFRRISALHSHAEVAPPAPPIPLSPRTSTH